MVGINLEWKLGVQEFDNHSSGTSHFDQMLLDPSRGKWNVTQKYPLKTAFLLILFNQHSFSGFLLLYYEKAFYSKVWKLYASQKIYMTKEGFEMHILE